jgi:o-succinylbenzoate synthase
MSATIEEVRLLPYRLPLRDPWPTPEGPVTERHGVILALIDTLGNVGLGDAAPLPGFGLETIGSSIAALRLAADRLIGLPTGALLEAAAQLTKLAPVAATPAARHAVDLAMHDLAGRIEGAPIARLLGGDEALESVRVNVAVPRVDAARSVTLAREAVSAGATALKVKVGGATLDEDLERVRRVREAVGSRVALRVDANQAWSEEEALAAMRAMAPHDIEYVEQPVVAANVEALARLRRASVVKIAADESACDLRMVRRILDMEAADVLVVKPMVLGGLRAAREAAALAGARGVATVVTSLIESAVGRTGALHLAASLGAMPHAHGLATGSALRSDVTMAPEMKNGAIELPDRPGLGLELGAEQLRGAETVVAA